MAAMGPRGANARGKKSVAFSDDTAAGGNSL